MVAEDPDLAPGYVLFVPVSIKTKQTYKDLLFKGEGSYLKF